MTRALLLVLLFLAASLAWAGGARAHTRSESHTSWVVDGSVVRVTFSVAELEADRLTHGRGRPDDATLLAYLAPRVQALTPAGPCPAAAPAQATAAAAGFRRFEFAFRCANDDITLRSEAFFDLVPSHVDLAQVRTPRGDYIEQVLTADKPDLAWRAQSGMKSASFLTFVGMGVMHIFTGVDHMSFLVGLVLISRRLRDLTFVVTGFTIGHSLTLALAVTGVLRPHAEYIDALVALTIALIGVENLSVSSGKPGVLAGAIVVFLLAMLGLRLGGVVSLPALLLLGSALFAGGYLLVSGHLREAGRLRLVVTLVFGLIHGFGFAADLLEAPIPKTDLLKLLAGFNIGVEIGQLSLVLAMSGLVLLLGKLKLALPRPIVTDVLATLLVALGTFWFVSRSVT